MNMENLKALVYGKETTPYQRALALREFKDLTERVELLQGIVNKNCNIPRVSNLACRCGKPYSQKDLQDGMCHKCCAPTG